MWLYLNPNSLDNKGSCWILLDFYCSVTMLRGVRVISFFFSHRPIAVCTTVRHQLVIFSLVFSGAAGLDYQSIHLLVIDTRAVLDRDYGICCVELHVLTPSLRRPCIHAIFFTRILFFESHAGSHVNTPLVAVTNVGWRVYTPVFLGAPASVPPDKRHCLIPLSTTCSVEVPGTNL